MKAGTRLLQLIVKKKLKHENIKRKTRKFLSGLENKSSWIHKYVVKSCTKTIRTGGGYLNNPDDLIMGKKYLLLCTMLVIRP
jgi:hypothetical protein